LDAGTGHTDVVDASKPLVATLVDLNLIVDQFFIHAHDAQKTLKAKWLNVNHLPWKRLWEQPLDDIRIHFGARIALYFAFFGVYTKMLVAPALAGVLLQLYWTLRGGICWYTA
jgi:anoctamin-10